MQSRSLGMQIPQILQIRDFHSCITLQAGMGHLSGALGETLCSSAL